MTKKKVEFDLSGKSSMNEEELAAQNALEAQLQYTQERIENMLTKHPHYGDDCGEYLRSALELSARLMFGRENGIEGLIDVFKELGRMPEGGEIGYDDELSTMYACDGISPAVEALVLSYEEEVTK